MQYNSHYVVQGHSRSSPILLPKPICHFLLVNNTKLHPILYCFKLLQIIDQNFCCQAGMPLFNALIHSESLKIKTTKFGISKLETSLYSMV